MYCSNCGAKCQDGTQFCAKCGKKLTNNESQKTEYSSNHVPGQMEVTRDTASGGNHELLTGKSFLKIRFPTAGVFLLLHGVISLYHAACRLGNNPDQYLFVGAAGYFFWPTLLQFLVIVAISVLLFRRKINKLLAVLLVLYDTWSILACIYNAPMYSTLVWRGMISCYGWSPIDFLSHSVSPYFILFNVEILSYITMVLLAASLVQNENRFCAVIKKLWYIPGILSCLGAVIWALYPQFYTIRLFVLVLCLILEHFFLGWWLTHPYKKQYAPVQCQNQATGISSCHDGKNEAIPERPNNNSVDEPSFGYAVLGFFVPMAGLILYLVWREETPLRAKSAGKGALVGVIVWVGLSVIMAILSVLLPMMVLKGYY